MRVDLPLRVNHSRLIVCVVRNTIVVRCRVRDSVHMIAVPLVVDVSRGMRDNVLPDHVAAKYLCLGVGNDE